MPSSRLTLESVTVQGAGHVILNDVSLQVPTGSLVEIRGANGVGKSTLLAVAAKLVDPRRGHIACHPRRSYLPERFVPPVGMTAAAYVGWMARVRGIPLRRRAQATQEALARVRLPLNADPMRLMSKGTLQRVGIAASLIGEPAVMILDEPLSGLDDDGRDVVLSAIRSACASGCSVLVANHGESIASADDRTLELWNGGLRTYQAAVLRVIAERTGSESHVGGWKSDRIDQNRIAISVSDSQAGQLLQSLISHGWRVSCVEQEPRA
jgi:ABC-type multidrug transport system ATPase subunit